MKKQMIMKNEVRIINNCNDCFAVAVYTKDRIQGNFANCCSITSDDVDDVTNFPESCPLEDYIEPKEQIEQNEKNVDIIKYCNKKKISLSKLQDWINNDL